MAIIYIKTSRDTHIFEANPTKNFRGEPELLAGYGTNQANTNANSFIKFSDDAEWGNIPNGASIIVAKLNLFCTAIDNGTTDPFLVGVNTFGWDVSNITWNNAPHRGTDGLLSGFNVGFSATQNEWSLVDVTDYIRKARFSDTSFRQKGLRIISTKGSGSVGRGKFGSENRSTAQPFIAVSYFSETPVMDNTTTITVDKQGLLLKGSNLKNGGVLKVESSSSGSTGPFSLLGNATVNYSEDSWEIVDKSNAPAPGAPANVQAVPLTAGSNDIKITWTEPARPARVRHYRAYKVLSDGTESIYTPVQQKNFSPGINNYVIQKKNGTLWTDIAKVNGTTFQYIDRGVVLNQELEYRIVAYNDQDIASVPAYITGLNLDSPPVPVFETLTTPNREGFKLTGSGGSYENTYNDKKIIIYSSNDGSTYTQVGTVPMPKYPNDVTKGQDEWDFDLFPTVRSPAPPVVEVRNLFEKSITISWTTPKNEGTKKWFKISQSRSGRESEKSAAKSATLTPIVNGYVLERKLENESDALFTEIARCPGDGCSDLDSGSLNSVTDTNVSFGTKYVYRLTIINNRNESSTPVLKNASTFSPGPPTMFPVKKKTDIDNSEYTQISGAGINQANSIVVNRSTDGALWFPVEEQVIYGIPEGGLGIEEWWVNDKDIPVQPPRVPAWVNLDRPVDTGNDGTGVVHLKWTHPLNISTKVYYQSIRKFGDVSGSPSSPGEITILPTIVSYYVQRRISPLSGQQGNSNNEWQLIATLTGDINNPIPQTFYDDESVQFDKTYEYRVIAKNNFGANSDPSTIKVLNTFNPPAPPPEIEAIPPEISNPRPSGVVDVSGTGPVRIVWDYTHLSEDPQASYKLKIEYTDNNDIGQTKYWNGSDWINSVTSVNTSNHFANVDIDVFADTTDYQLTLTSTSVSGGQSEDLVWEINGSLAYTTYFDTLRTITRVYTEEFETYRKVNSRDDELLGMPTLSIQWAVEPQLPLEVDDTEWEGGGNSWAHVVFDNDGHPEAYAEIDFERENDEYHFKCDSRGRIVLTIPDDIPPGIYTFRERGPSMAPRTIQNYVVYDPWMIYAHGHRHSYGGPDPIYGITKEQIADNANIHPSQVQGAESLAELVGEYGSNIQDNLERKIAAGHGVYTIEGFDHGAWNTGNLNINGGICWDNDRLRKLSSKTLNFTSDGTYKVYVENGVLKNNIRTSFPPNSAPLWTVVVSGSLATATFTDERIKHPETVNTGTVTPVRWGAEFTDDLDHNGSSLREVLEFRINQIEERFLKEESLEDNYKDEVNRIQAKIDNYESDKLLSRRAMLSLGFVTTMKHLYSKFHKKAAENLLLENFESLENNQLVDVIDYLNNIARGGLSSKMSNISAFNVGDELSSITNLVIRNGVATLPNNWTRGSQYVLRTLRIEGPPAHYLDFHVVYENTNASFKVKGSQSSNGIYLPKEMTKISTIKDSNLNTIFNIEDSKNCYIDTYRAYFKTPGDESIIEMIINGGDPGDGVRLRGFSVVSA